MNAPISARTRGAINAGHSEMNPMMSSDNNDSQANRIIQKIYSIIGRCVLSAWYICTVPFRLWCQVGLNIFGFILYLLIR